ncbi:MAG: hypothetical protein WCP20_10900 [Desulfuromonadales bacterium]
MSDDSNFQSIVIKSIESYARVETKVASMEQAVSMLRGENKEILGKISESLVMLATIQAQIVQNISDHKIIHKRVDDLKDEVEAIEALTLTMQKNCQSTNYQDIITRLRRLESDMHRLCDSLKLVNYKIKGFPVWLVIVLVVFFGLVSDLYNHLDWIKRILTIWK